MQSGESAANALNEGPAHGRHRVVIAGCGFGGLFAARALRRASVDVTIVDRSNHHLFQPLLYQIARRAGQLGFCIPRPRTPAARLRRRR